MHVATSRPPAFKTTFHSTSVAKRALVVELTQPIKGAARLDRSPVGALGGGAGVFSTLSTCAASTEENPHG